MGQWHQSGTRRDACVALYEAGEVRLPELKARLQDHYDRQLDTERFRRTVQQLVDEGHLHHRTEGLHDVYELTESGEAELEAHLAWLGEETGL